MSELVSYKGFLSLGFFLFVFAAEYYQPWCKVPHSIKRYGRNLGFSVINAIASPLLIIGLTHLVTNAIPSWRSDAFNSSWMIIVDIIILDLFLYCWHRATHYFPLLWRFHIIHHLDETLDSTSALRFHFGEVMLAATVRLMFIIVFSIPLETVIIFELLVFFAAVFHHSNISLPKLTDKILSMVVVTPGIHWVHHHREARYSNSCYGTIFSFWDRLFNSSAQFDRRPDMPIGVNQLSDRTFLSLLAAPFKRESSNV